MIILTSQTSTTKATTTKTSNKNRFTKPVAFNKTSEEDQTILTHLEGRNFSGYVKELILADLNHQNAPQDDREGTETVYNGTFRIVQKTNSGGIKYVMPGF